MSRARGYAPANKEKITSLATGLAARKAIKAVGLEQAALDARAQVVERVKAHLKHDLSNSYGAPVEYGVIGGSSDICARVTDMWFAFDDHGRIAFLSECGGCGAITKLPGHNLAYLGASLERDTELCRTCEMTGKKAEKNPVSRITILEAPEDAEVESVA